METNEGIISHQGTQPSVDHRDT